MNWQTIEVEDGPDAGDFESLEAAENFYEEEAQQLMSALATSLPQGTIHRLLVHMLEHVKCYYRGLGAEE
jgi:hypothetical protein